MIINNWWVTVDFYIGYYDNLWPLLFFVVWYVIVIFVITNLFVAYFMEIYSENVVKNEVQHKRRKECLQVYRDLKDSKEFSNTRLTRLRKVESDSNDLLDKDGDLRILAKQILELKNESDSN